MSEKELSFTVNVMSFKKELTEPFAELNPADNKITLICEKDKIYVDESNTQNVCRLYVELNENMLENYENNLDDGEQLELTVLVDKLNIALQNLTGKSKFVLDSKKQKINISSGIYNYGVGLKTRTTKKKTFPKLEFDNTIDLKGEDFFTIIDKCTKLDGFVDLQIKHELLDENAFILNLSVSEKETNNNLDVGIDKFNMIKENIKTECSVSLDFIATDFLTVAKVTIKNAPNIVLHIKDTYPMLISYNIEDNKGIVKLVLAPRMK